MIRLESTSNEVSICCTKESKNKKLAELSE